MADTTAATAPGAPSGFDQVFGFLDGLGGITDRVAGIIDTGANAAEDIARGRGAITDQQQTEEQKDLDMALQLRGFNRKDNVTQMWVVGAVAVAVIYLLAR